ncbi:MAG: hypothetical protein K8R88_06920, partial [Armatimonadetes bacterium]|nr:hypothetical protein [Armatimonadota bacterium]
MDIVLELTLQGLPPGALSPRMRLYYVNEVFLTMQNQTKTYRECIGFPLFPNSEQPLDWPKYMMLSGGLNSPDPTSILSGIFRNLASAADKAPEKEIVALAVPNATTFLRSLWVGRQLATADAIAGFDVADAVQIYGGADPQLVEADWPMLGFTVADCWLGTSQWFFNAPYHEFDIRLNERGLLKDDVDAHVVRTIMDYTFPDDSPH